MILQFFPIINEICLVYVGINSCQCCNLIRYSKLSLLANVITVRNTFTNLYASHVQDNKTMDEQY